MLFRSRDETRGLTVMAELCSYDAVSDMYFQRIYPHISYPEQAKPQLSKYYLDSFVLARFGDVRLAQILKLPSSSYFTDAEKAAADAAENGEEYVPARQILLTITCGENMSDEEFIAAVAQSGLVGLGGAGFPASVKLDIKDLSRLDTVIINGAECEPYITSDTRTMLDRGEEIAWGIKMLETYLKAKRVIIGIEKNKPQCIRAMEQLAAKDSCVSVLPLPALYPQGGEKVLIYHATGRIVGEGKLPIDAGVIVMNCTSLADMGRYFLTGMPLVEKSHNHPGTVVKDRKNVLVPIGTSLKDLIDFAGGCKAPAGKVLYGGPMMGISVPDLEQPVLKTTNAVTAFNEADARTPDPTACIRCGSCVDHCPLNLMPAEIERAFDKKDGRELEKLKVNLCMECGCCAFICPAHRPLVQVNKLAKGMLRDWQAKEKAQAEKEKARQEQLAQMKKEENK